MKKNVILSIAGLILITISIVSCNANKINSHKNEISQFEVSTVKPIILENGKIWSKALKNKDIQMLSNLYDQNAHYLPDADNALHGNKEISEYWEASMPFLIDIQLDMETLEGTKELLYETGKGIALIMNQKGNADTLKYKYVNVWKLNKNGEYKVVIDTFNDIKK